MCRALSADRRATPHRQRARRRQGHARRTPPPQRRVPRVRAGHGARAREGCRAAEEVRPSPPRRVVRGCWRSLQVAHPPLPCLPASGLFCSARFFSHGIPPALISHPHKKHHPTQGRALQKNTLAATETQRQPLVHALAHAHTDFGPHTHTGASQHRHTADEQGRRRRHHGEQGRDRQGVHRVQETPRPRARAGFAVWLSSPAPCTRARVTPLAGTRGATTRRCGSTRTTTSASTVSHVCSLRRALHRLLLTLPRHCYVALLVHCISQTSQCFSLGIFPR